MATSQALDGRGIAATATGPTVHSKPEGATRACTLGAGFALPSNK